MNTIKKILRTVPFLVLLFVLFALYGDVFAQDMPTLLPAENVNIGGVTDECTGMGDMIRSGNIHLRNLPCFIKYFTQMLVGLAGSIAVLFVMIGGYRYVISSDEKKDEAKKTITYALIGLAVSLLAWIIIDLVLQIATE